MSDTLATIHRLTPLADVFWREVTAAPWRYDLFHLLRRIDAQGGERYPLGRAPLPKFESLRIGQTPSMGFAPATLASAQKREIARCMRYRFSASVCSAPMARCRFI